MDDRAAGETARLFNRLSDAFFERFARWRDQMLLSQRFHEAAFRLPGIRSLARRETRALFDICAGFVYTQVLLACVRLGVFAMLRDGPLAITEIAARTALPVESIERLAAAAVSLRLLSRRPGGRIGLGTLGAAVAKDSSIAAMVEHHATLYVDLYDPVALLGPNKPRTGMSAYWPYTTADRPAALSDGEVATYTELMATSQRMIAAEVVGAYNFENHRHLLDIGGGDGTFIATVAKAAPGLSMTLFDLPAVAAIAQSRFDADRLGHRTSAIGGDFYRDSLPTGADVVTLVRVLFDHDDTSAVSILKAARSAMEHDATLVIAEPMSGGRYTGPVMDAYFSFYLLAMGKGRARSANDFKRLLSEAGFYKCRVVEPRNPLLVSLIVALPKKPS